MHRCLFLSLAQVTSCRRTVLSLFVTLYSSDCSLLPPFPSFSITAEAELELLLSSLSRPSLHLRSIRSYTRNLSFCLILSLVIFIHLFHSYSLSLSPKRRILPVSRSRVSLRCAHYYASTTLMLLSLFDAYDKPRAVSSTRFAANAALYIPLRSRAPSYFSSGHPSHSLSLFAAHTDTARRESSAIDGVSLCISLSSLSSAVRDLNGRTRPSSVGPTRLRE